MCKENWTKEEPEVLNTTCEACGSLYDEEIMYCDNCGGDDSYLSYETNIEGLQCIRCGRDFDIWENYYSNSKNDCCCQLCYDEMKESDKK